MKFATNLDNNTDFELNLSELFRTHTFIQGMTGSTKTNLILRLVELVRTVRPDVQMVFLDDQEEYTELPNTYKNIKLIDENFKFWSLEKAKEIGKQTRLTGQSVVIKLDDFEEQKDREQFVADFIIGYNSLGKEVGTPAMIFIDEADQYCPTKTNRANVASRYPIINMMKRARKLNISLVLATLSLHEVDIRARKECANRVVGKTREPRDRNVVKDMLYLNEEQTKQLNTLKKGEFFVSGDIFKDDATKIHVELSTLTKKQAGVEQSLIQTETSDNLDNILEKAVENKTDQSLVEILQQEIANRDKSISNLKVELEQQKIKTKQAWSEGFQQSEKQWKDKNFLERLKQ